MKQDMCVWLKKCKTKYDQVNNSYYVCNEMKFELKKSIQDLVQCGFFK